MSLVSKFSGGLKGLKLNELPAYARKFQGENMRLQQMQAKLDNGLENYRLKYIVTGSATPVYQFLGYGFLFAYAAAWPQEYKHFCAERDAKLAGETH